jgi:serine/threonine protein kinase
MIMSNKGSCFAHPSMPASKMQPPPQPFNSLHRIDPLEGTPSSIPMGMATPKSKPMKATTPVPQFRTTALQLRRGASTAPSRGNGFLDLSRSTPGTVNLPVPPFKSTGVISKRDKNYFYKQTPSTPSRNSYGYSPDYAESPVSARVSRKGKSSQPKGLKNPVKVGDQVDDEFSQPSRKPLAEFGVNYSLPGLPSEGSPRGSKHSGPHSKELRMVDSVEKNGPSDQLTSARSILFPSMKEPPRLFHIKSNQHAPPFPHFLTLQYFETHSNLEFVIPEDCHEAQEYEDYYRSHFIEIQALGSGSFSDVYRVQRISDRKEFALKRLKRPYTSKKDRIRRLEEVQVWLMCAHHRNCVGLEMAWEQHGVLYMLTELCALGSLEQLLRQRSQEPLPEPHVWELLSDIVDGLGWLHERGLVHLDLKPANIFLSEHGLCKIGDFGLTCPAVLLNRAMYSDRVAFSENELNFATSALNRNQPPQALSKIWTKSKSFSSDELGDAEDREGDSLYAAPEARTFQYTMESDIFSFGLIALEMISNAALPEQDESYDRLRNGDISEFLSEIPSTTSKELLNLIEACLNPTACFRPSAVQIKRSPAMQVAHEARLKIQLPTEDPVAPSATPRRTSFGNASENHLTPIKSNPSSTTTRLKAQTDYIHRFKRKESFINFAPPVHPQSPIQGRSESLPVHAMTPTLTYRPHQLLSPQLPQRSFSFTPISNTENFPLTQPSEVEEANEALYHSSQENEISPILQNKVTRRLLFNDDLTSTLAPGSHHFMTEARPACHLEDDDDESMDVSFQDSPSRSDKLPMYSNTKMHFPPRAPTAASSHNLRPGPSSDDFPMEDSPAYRNPLSLSVED